MFKMTISRNALLRVMCGKVMYFPHFAGGIVAQTFCFMIDSEIWWSVLVPTREVID
jgi:hypothetical protein